MVLEAEGAADNRLAEAAVSRASSDRSPNAVTDSARSGLRPISLTRPPSSRFVRLCVKSGRFVTSGLDAILNNADDFTPEQIATELFEGVTVEQVKRIIAYARAHDG